MSLALAVSVLLIAASPAVSTVEQLEDERLRAQARNDAGFPERHYSDDYTSTSILGTVRTKAEVIASFRSGELKYESASQVDRKVRVYGDTAIVTGVDTIKGTDRGKDISGPRRFTRVWVKQGGQWRLVANHSTRMPQ